MNSIRRAIFPAGGLGTRFLPATKAQMLLINASEESSTSQ